MLQLARILTFIIALGIVALGVLGGSLGILAGALGPASDRLTMVTAGIALMALTTGLGLPLARESWRALSGRPSSIYRPRRIWWWVVVYGLALAGGQLVLSVGMEALFPVFHLLAATVPPLLLVALVARGLQVCVRRRNLVLQTSSGAFVSTTLALTLEGAFVFGLLMAVFIAVGLQPGGGALLQDLAGRLQDPVWLENSFSTVSPPLSPWVIVVALLVMAVVVPTIEEVVKTLGVPLLAYQRPSRVEAFLWGVAGGAGFALAENLFNALGGLDLWAPVAAARIGATLLHGFTGGAMGLAWYYLLLERRWMPALGLYLLSVGVHAAWNALATGLAFASLAGSGPASALTGLVGLALLMLLALLACTVAVALVVVTRQLRTESLPMPDRSVSDGPPPAALLDEDGPCSHKGRPDHVL